MWFRMCMLGGHLEGILERQMKGPLKNTQGYFTGPVNEQDSLSNQELQYKETSLVTRISISAYVLQKAVVGSGNLQRLSVK